MGQPAIEEETVVSLLQIEKLSRRALQHHGADPTAATSLARAIAAAEGEGIHSHGLHYLKTYCDHLDCGKVNPRAVPVLQRPAPSVLMVDAANGFAHPAIDMGFEALIPLAREMGLAALSVNRSYNCGVLGYHVKRLAAAGLIGIGFTNAPASIAPPGGKQPVIGTNPFAVAAPARNGSDARLIIDQSASVIAKSELSARAQKGKAIPEGWALDCDGKPTTDPKAGLAGTMVPTGGYKGFGVGLFVEIMAAALAGANLGIHASSFSGTSGVPPGTGQFFIALSPDSFSGDAFHERMDALCQAAGAEADSRLPGARRMTSYAKSQVAGVTVSRQLLASVDGLSLG